MKIDLYTRCWNDAHMLGFMFRNYDDLVQRYVVYDDGSTDGSLDILAAHPKVEIRDQAAYRNPSSRILAALSLLETCWHESRGRADWVIVCDIDELLYHPKIDLYIAAPLTATSTAKLELGIGDNQALTTLCESITNVTMNPITAGAMKPALCPPKFTMPMPLPI